MDINSNALNWFEIPVTDMQRAKHFYQVAFEIHMEEMNMSGMDMAMFPYKEGSGKASGALVKGEWHTPSMDGAVIYLNANKGMEAILARIEEQGGKVLMGKTEISPEIGFMAFFVDSEGNRMALHSQQ